MAVTGNGWDPRLSVHTLSTRHWDLAQDLDLYDRLGVRRISIALPKLLAAGVDASVKEITARGLHVDGVYAGRAFDLTDESTWPEVRDAMVTAVEVGSRVGADTLQTTGGSGAGRAFEWAAERLGAALGPVAVAARRSGLRIALEPTRPQFAHVGFVHSLRDGLELAADLDLWLIPDSAHLWWEPGLDELLAEGAGRFAAVQIADLAFSGPVLERVVPGDGRLGLGQLMATVTAAGFVGPFELELIGQAIDDEGYEPALRRSLGHLQGLLDPGSPSADPSLASA